MLERGGTRTRMGKVIFADRAYIDKKLEEQQFALVDYFNRRFEAMERDILATLGVETSIPIPEAEKPLERDNRTVKREPEEEPEWIIWKKEMKKRVEIIAKQYPNYFESANNLLSRIYQKMKCVYGFVLEQERKPFKDLSGANNRRITTLEVVAYSSQWRNIFECVLGNMEEEARIRREKEKAVNAEMLSKSYREIIQPLIEARGDHSNYGCSTYTVVISRMKKRGLDMDAAKAAYQAKNGLKRKISNRELIDGDQEVKRRYIEAVTEIMCELKKAN